jgi:hypothetical protein
MGCCVSNALFHQFKRNHAVREYSDQALDAGPNSLSHKNKNIMFKKSCLKNHEFGYNKCDSHQ